MGLADCRVRLQNPVWLSSTAIQRDATHVSASLALVMEQEVKSLLAKEAIGQLPPPDTESWFYSRYSLFQ